MNLLLRIYCRQQCFGRYCLRTFYLNIQGDPAGSDETMQSIIESWLFLTLVATILLTPGPTNTLLAASGVQIGFRRSIVLIPAEAAGYFCAITLWGSVLSVLAQQWPALPSILKLISVSYILWLAIKLWKTSNIKELSQQESIGARQLFLATFLNPKALLFALTIFPAATWSNLHNYLLVMLAFLGLLIPIASLWVLFGHLLNTGHIKWLTQHGLQRTASLVLFGFTLPLTYNAISHLY